RLRVLLLQSLDPSEGLLARGLQGYPRLVVALHLVVGPRTLPGQRLDYGYRREHRVPAIVERGVYEPSAAPFPSQRRSHHGQRLDYVSLPHLRPRDLAAEALHQLVNSLRRVDRDDHLLGLQRRKNLSKREGEHEVAASLPPLGIEYDEPVAVTVKCEADVAFLPVHDLLEESERVGDRVDRSVEDSRSIIERRDLAAQPRKDRGRVHYRGAAAEVEGYLDAVSTSFAAPVE